VDLLRNINTQLTKNFRDDSIVWLSLGKSDKKTSNIIQKILKAPNFTQFMPPYFLNNEIVGHVTPSGWQGPPVPQRIFCFCNGSRAAYANPNSSPAFAKSLILVTQRTQYACLRKSRPLQAQLKPFPACHKNTTQLTIFFNFDQFIASQETKPPALPARPLNVHPSGKMYGSLRQFSK